MRRAVGVMSGSIAGKYRRRYHAVVEVDTDVLRAVGRTAPAMISDRSIGLLRVVARYEAVPCAPDYPLGKCQASRQRQTVISTGEYYASTRSLPFDGVLN